jgi:REP element-mobilizing transposase RayT
MPRQPRIEYEGALYHIMNRGNYREYIFDVSGAGELFEQTLFDACKRFGWLLHAYVCLSNHFHIALETPEANLVRGMQWFSSTFGNRFNRLVRTPGHIFQGRYKSLLIEDFLSGPKGAPWKVVLAGWIKSQCGVSNQWLSEHLHMGHPSNISRMIALETNDLGTHRKLWKKLRTTR